MSFRAHHILVPVAVAPGDDLSLAEELVDAACDLARMQPDQGERDGSTGLPTRISLVYVNVNKGTVIGTDTGFAPPTYHEMMAELWQGNRDAAIEALAKLKTRAEKRGVGRANIATLVLDPIESTGETIAHAARDSGADLIVVLSHGRKGLKRLFLGSVAERVAHVAEVPVLILRPKR